MAEITPTVGRKVWFYETHDQTEPIDATVVKVHADAEGEATPQSLVNLVTFDAAGNHGFRSSVAVGGEDSAYPHYRWMPYQKAQAAKAETA